MVTRGVKKNKSTFVVGVCACTRALVAGVVRPQVLPLFHKGFGEVGRTPRMSPPRQRLLILTAVVLTSGMLNRLCLRVKCFYDGKRKVFPQTSDANGKVDSTFMQIVSRLYDGHVVVMLRPDNRCQSLE